MSKLYTFPTQTTLAGVVTFKVRTLQGSGTSSPTDKYFSSNFSLVNQTDLRGGEIAVPTAEFTIDDDVNNLFQDTIFPTLTEHVTAIGDNNVIVSVELDGITKFVGAVAPKSVNISYYYADNDILQNQKTSITFQCESVLGLLKAFTGEAVAVSLRTHSDIVTFNATRFPYPASSGVTDKYYWASIYLILKTILNEITNGGFGITIDSDVVDVDYKFATYSHIDDTRFNGIANTDTHYCFNLLHVDDDTGKEGMRLDNQKSEVGLMVGSDVDGHTYLGYFDKNESDYVENAFDLLVGIVNSFSLIMKFEYLATDSVKILFTTRKGNKIVTIPQVVSSEDTPISNLAWGGIDISSQITGNSLVKEYRNSVGNDVFSRKLLLDFRDDTTFIGNDFLYGDPKKSIFSLCAKPTTSYFEVEPKTSRLIRDCGIGENYLSEDKSTFKTAITGWSVPAIAVGSITRKANPSQSDILDIGVLEISSIPSDASNDVRIQCGIAPTSDVLFGSAWLKVVPLTTDAINIRFNAYIYYTQLEEEAKATPAIMVGKAHLFTGVQIFGNGNAVNAAINRDIYISNPELNRNWKLISANYNDLTLSSRIATRVDGSTRDSNVDKPRPSRTNRDREVQTSAVGIRLVIDTFASGCAVIEVDNVKVFDGISNTPDLVGATIEKFFIADGVTSEKRITANGIVTDIDIGNVVEYDGLDFHVQKITHDYGEYQTDVELINYRGN